MEYEAYLSAEEIATFLKAKEQECLGFCYEWEDEYVVHLHTHPLVHAFGQISRCLYLKSEDITSWQYDPHIHFIVCVNPITGQVNLYLVDKTKLSNITAKFIPDRADLYSRSKGLLEIDILAGKHVAIIGLGSFGSQIAIELAKAGVGEFSLVDFDRIELHNLGRHTCTLKDLGRLKTDAISENFLGKNPIAVVHKYAIDISSALNTLEQIVQACDLIICATDNNQSRFVLSTALFKYQKVGIFGRATTRAAGGDVFRYRPGGPCYACLVGSNIINTNDEEISSEEAGRRSGAIPAYASKEDVNALVQVGLAIDIEPICNLMLKLALVELSKGKESGISSLEEDLQYDAYIWANRRDKNFKNWHPFYKSGTKQTILKWYGVNVQKNEHCTICSDNIELDLGDEYDKLPRDQYAKLNIKVE